MNLTKSIRKLRILALFLFLTPAIGLLGSLILHNYFLNFKFEKTWNYKFTQDKPGESFVILCDENSEYCSNINFLFKKLDKLENCYMHKIEFFFVNKDDEKLHLYRQENPWDKIKDIKEDVYLKYRLGNEINEFCILNSKQLFLYNIFPFYFETIYKIKHHKKTAFGTSEAVNPFFKGESSISNIVKRFPINFFFKPILYLTVLLMVFYWIYYNTIIKKLVDTKKNFNFFIFGMLSAAFLFLHVIFLGWTFESEFLTKLRRTFIVFFILFEILSQAFLIKKILTIKDKFNKYFHSLIVLLKLIFVIIICSSSVIILSILSFYDLSPQVDYILEWNYFLILLLFYFLSFLMWKKQK